MISERYILKQGLSVLISIGLICWAVISASASEEDKDKKPSAIDVVARTVVYLEFDIHESTTVDIDGKRVEYDLYYLNVA
jgi:hypothetical protein